MAKKEAPKVPESTESSVRTHFTKDLLAQMADMSIKEMESLMKDLPSTRHWIAILKYTSMRMPLLDMSLRGTDPVKDPSKISWSQGAMAGLCDIENYVIELNAPKQADVDEDGGSSDGRQDGVIVG